MSSYGTSADYCTGYDDGADETKGIYDDLVAAARGLIEQWDKGNLSEAVQALSKAVSRLPEGGRYVLDETTYPPGYQRPDEDDEDDEEDPDDPDVAYDDQGNLRAGDS